MPYNRDLGLRFVHIPKNAGTSIIKFFGMENECHCEAWLEEVEPMTTFCIYRDPVKRFNSCYNYAKTYDSYWHGKNNPHPDYELLKNASVSECIELLKAGKLKHQGWSPQHRWIYKDHKVHADYLINIEHLEEEISLMLNELNITLNKEIPVINNISKKVSLSLREMTEVSKFYSKDYEVFQI